MELSCRNRNETRPDLMYELPAPPMEAVQFDEGRRPNPRRVSGSATAALLPSA